MYFCACDSFSAFLYVCISANEPEVCRQWAQGKRCREFIENILQRIQKGEHLRNQSTKVFHMQKWPDLQQIMPSQQEMGSFSKTCTPICHLSISLSIRLSQTVMSTVGQCVLWKYWRVTWYFEEIGLRTDLCCYKTKQLSSGAVVFPLIKDRNMYSVL